MNDTKMSLTKRINRLLKIQFTEHTIDNISRNEIAYQQTKTPADDMERAYVHYCFLKLNYPRAQWYLSVLYAILRFIPDLLRFSWNAVNIKPETNSGGLVVVSDKVPGYADLLPAELEQQYGKPRECRNFNCNIHLKVLSGQERKFLWKCFKRHPFSIKYLYHIMNGLALYNGIILQYSPDAIATYASEDSCRVSVLTQYCEEHSIRHIDFMHGERFNGYTQAYMRFTEIYVWNDAYKQLYERAGIMAQKWNVYIPGKLTPIVRDSGILEKKIVKCYLCGEDHLALQRLKLGLDQLQKKGYVCVIRWHPRFSAISDVRRVFSEYTLEDPAKVTIEDSLRSTSYALSTYSTVLLQAYYSNIPIIVDDYSNIKLAELLQYIDYWGFQACYARLSEFVNVSCDKGLSL